MNIVVVSGSMRANSQSLKVSKWMNMRLKAEGVDGDIVNLHELKLPIYDDGETIVPQANSFKEQMQNADGFVFVSPEWNGSMSVGIINMMHYLKHELAHKPVMLVGVSNGRGGAYPIAQMKQIGPKNRHYVICPENLIVGSVKEMFNDHDMSESVGDAALKARAVYALKILLLYAKLIDDTEFSRYQLAGFSKRRLSNYYTKYNYLEITYATIRLW